MTTFAVSPELFLMLLADARLPVAGHTQSGSLEPAVAAGLTAIEVPDYMAVRLATVTRVEMATAVVALRHIRQRLKLNEVETAWAARTPSAAMRRTSRAQARAFLRLVRRLWPDAPGVTAVDGPGVSRAVALAAAADVCGLSPLSLARLIGYDDMQTVASAALKLLPLDPLATTSWVYAALPAIDALAQEVSSLTEPEDIPVVGAPQIEAWAEAHAVTARRLFSA
jgi:urease accessory protein